MTKLIALAILALATFHAINSVELTTANVLVGHAAAAHEIN